MTIGFTGTRKGLTEQQKTQLTIIMRCLHDHDFHHGDCIGADAEAHRIAERAGKCIIIHPPVDKKYRAYCTVTLGHYVPPDKYIARNHAIVDASDKIIACPDGPERSHSGTWATIRYAQKTGKKVMIIYPWGATKVV